MTKSSGWDQLSFKTGLKPKLGASINNLVVRALALALRSARGMCVGEGESERLLGNNFELYLTKLVLTAQLKVGWSDSIDREHLYENILFTNKLDAAFLIERKDA